MRANVASRLAFIEQAKSGMSGSTDLKPTTVETTTGKKPSMNAAMTFGMIPKPNHTTNSGAMAIFGTLCENTSNGYTKLSTVREYAISSAIGTPNAIDSANPPNVA